MFEHNYGEYTQIVIAKDPNRPLLAETDQWQAHTFECVGAESISGFLDSCESSGIIAYESVRKPSSIRNIECVAMHFE